MNVLIYSIYEFFHKSHSWTMNDIYIYIYIYIYIKEDLALSNLLGLIYHKIQSSNLWAFRVFPLKIRVDSRFLTMKSPLQISWSGVNPSDAILKHTQRKPFWVSVRIESTYFKLRQQHVKRPAKKAWQGEKREKRVIIFFREGGLPKKIFKKISHKKNLLATNV